MNNKLSKKKKAQRSNILTVIVCALLILCAATAIFLSRYDWHVEKVLGGLAPVGHSAEIGGALSETGEPRSWDYFDDAVMVGDSITYGMAAYGYLSFDHVFAKIGLHQGTALTSKCVYTSRTQGYSISEALSKAKPGKIFVTLGINAIYSYKSDSFYDNYRAFLTKIKNASPDSIIVVQSIFPVTQQWAIANGKPNCHQYVAYANQKLAKLAEEEGCYFLYTYQKLTDENGFLQAQYSGDGIHLSRKGYEAVFNYILTHPVTSSGKFTAIGAVTPPTVQGSTASKVIMPDLGDISSAPSDVESTHSAPVSNQNPTSSDASVSSENAPSDLSSENSAQTPNTSDSNSSNSSSEYVSDNSSHPSSTISEPTITPPNISSSITTSSQQVAEIS